MLVEGSLFRQVYDTVSQERAESEDKSILLFVANSDVDAVCAVRQLQNILETHESHFSVIPVGSYNEIRENCLTIKDTEELRTIFLINCGATENVRDLCGLNENVRLVIIDSHRPIWHGYHNDLDNATLVLLDRDDPVPKRLIPDYSPLDEHLRMGEDTYLRQLRGDLDDDEDELVEEEEEGSQPSTSQGGGAGRGQGRAPKRRKTSLSDEEKKRRGQLLDYYSEQSGFGKPSALLLYDLARQLNLDQGQGCAWLGILGLTDQLVHQRIDAKDYDRWSKYMALQVQKGQQARPLEDSAVANGGSSVRHDTLTVARIQDLRLTLMRHWTLMDALLNSSYTASRMQTWGEKGRANVKLLLAKMNVPLPQSTASFSTMSLKYRDALASQLRAHGPDFGLNVQSLMIDGFELRYKTDVRISATDMVLMMTMELGRPRVDQEEARMGFHDASDILDVDKNTGRIKSSMERVQDIFKSIVQQGGLAISRNQVQGSRKTKFWHLDLSSLDFNNKQDFQHPSTLHHLAIFLRDAMCRRHGVHKPMMIIGPPDASGHCFVVAIRSKETTGMMQNNPFARPFEEVIDSLKLELSKSTFDSSLYHIKRADAGQFLEELKDVVSKYEQEAAMQAAAQ